MRTYEFDEPLFEVLAQRIAVRRLVVDQTRRQPITLIEDRPVQQRFDEVDFVLVLAGNAPPMAIQVVMACSSRSTASSCGF